MVLHVERWKWAFSVPLYWWVPQYCHDPCLDTTPNSNRWRSHRNIWIKRRQAQGNTKKFFNRNARTWINEQDIAARQDCDLCLFLTSQRTDSRDLWCMEPSAFVDFIYVNNRVKIWFSARDANLFGPGRGVLIGDGALLCYFSNKKRDCSLRELYPQMDISLQTLKRRPVSVWCGK